MINSNRGPISHRFRDTATIIYSPLKIAAKSLQMETWLLLTDDDRRTTTIPVEFILDRYLKTVG